MAEIIEIGSDGSFELPEAPVESDVWKPVESKRSKENKPTAPTSDKSTNAPSKVFKAQSEVELKGLKTPDLNGLKATVVAYDRIAGRYAVLLGGGKTIKIKPENLFAWTMSPATASIKTTCNLLRETTANSSQPKTTKLEPSTVKAAAPTPELKVSHTVSLDSKNSTVVVKVKLPMLESSAGVKLQVRDTDLILTYGAGDTEFVRADFPVSVQPCKATSKFFKKSKTMKLSIPLQAKQ